MSQYTTNIMMVIICLNATRCVIFLFVGYHFLINHQIITEIPIIPTPMVEIVEIPISTPISYYVVRGGALLVCIYGWHILCVASAVSAASIALTVSTPAMGALVYQPGSTDLHMPLRLYNPSFPRRERADLVPHGEQVHISNGQVVHPELDGVMKNHISYLKE